MSSGYAITKGKIQPLVVNIKCCLLGIYDGSSRIQRVYLPCLIVTAIMKAKILWQWLFPTKQYNIIDPI